jgi:hypothetical protein
MPQLHVIDRLEFVQVQQLGPLCYTRRTRLEKVGGFDVRAREFTNPTQLNGQLCRGRQEAVPLVAE